MSYQTYILPNGIKVIHKKFSSSVAHCGLIINAGSRDEKADEHGLAHFIEHALFKGTHKRRAHQIINRLENVGGEINAYTSKEETCVYSSFLKDDLERSMELTGDLIFNSTFPEKELQKEKDIIIDEINSYKDSPAELIFDEFEELIYKDDPLGRNILGTPKFLRKFEFQNIQKFLQNNYHTNQMVFSCIGDYDFKKVSRLAAKYLGNIQPNLSSKKRIWTNNYSPMLRKVKKNTHQAHCIIGNIAYDIKHKNRLGLVLLNNLIGGPGMNSKMNIALREKSGYAYNTESFYSSYTETGLFGVYFGTEKEYLFKCIDLALKVFEKTRKNRLGQSQLHKAKRQLLGQIAISSENKENYMLLMGKSMLRFDRVDSFSEISSKIDLISESLILEIANEVLNPDSLSTLIYT